MIGCTPRIFRLSAAALCLAALAACAPLRELGGGGPPLNASVTTVRSSADGRSAAYYRLAPGEAVPAVAVKYMPASEWHNLGPGAQIDAIQAERRRGNVVLANGDNAWFLPEKNLQRRDKSDPAFRQIKPGDE